MRHRSERLRVAVPPVVLAVAIDLVVGEPPSWGHPVVWVGGITRRLESNAPDDRWGQLLYGSLCTALVVGGAGAVGWLAQGLGSRWEPLRLPVTVWLLKSSFALRGLARAAEEVGEALSRSDLTAARHALGSLVSRHVSDLPPPLLIAAAVESIAENASDAAVAPLLWYALGGLPAACAYRAANTMDSMWGYRGPYEHLGKTAARLDDLLNLLPARLTALSLVGGAWVTGKPAGRAWRTMQRDHGTTASPNAGWPISAMAGALGVELEKRGHYRLGVGGAQPDAMSIAQAVHLLYLTVLLPVALCLICEMRRDA